MENLPQQELESYERLAVQFDDAYIQLIQLLQDFFSYTESISVSQDGSEMKDEEEEEEGTGKDRSEEQKSASSFSEEMSAEESPVVGSVEKTDDDYDAHGDENIHGTTVAEATAVSENSTEGDNDRSSTGRRRRSVGGQSRRHRGNMVANGGQQHATNQLITMLLSFGKLLTKAFLNAERAHQLEQETRRLKRQNCLLKGVARNCRQYAKLNSIPSGIRKRLYDIESSLSIDDEQSSVLTEENQQHHCYCSSAEVGNPGKQVTDLLTLKQAIEQEINEIIAVKDAQMQALKMKFKNKIIGLNLAVDWLKKETSGRVQQLQLLLHQLKWENATDVEVLDEETALIWKQLDSEVMLNRHKTMVRVAEVAGKIDELNRKKKVDLEDEETVTSDSLAQIFSLSPSLPLNLTKPKKEDITRLGMCTFKWVYLKKDSPIGLALIGGTHHIPLVVWKVYGESVKGSLFPGDVILSIQANDLEHDLTDMKREDAVKLMVSLSGWCRFGIVRVPVKEIEQQLKDLGCWDFEILHDDPFDIVC